MTEMTMSKIPFSSSFHKNEKISFNVVTLRPIAQSAIMVMMIPFGHLSQQSIEWNSMIESIHYKVLYALGTMSKVSKIPLQIYRTGRGLELGSSRNCDRVFE